MAELPLQVGCVLEVLARLQAGGAHTGSSPKEIFEELRVQLGSKRPRNLGLQLLRTLRRAVGQGVLKLRAGRYRLCPRPQRKSSRKVSKSTKSKRKKRTRTTK